MKQRVQNLEAENNSLSKTSQTEGVEFKCYECDFGTKQKSVLKCHLYDKHEWQKDQQSEELDMSVGPRFCRKCDYEAEDGYDLDGHFWSEHDDEESPSLICKYCDESFPVMKELMRHKKLKHIEKVDFCWFLSTNSCEYGEENC